MEKGLNLIFSHFARLGLEMHIGRGDVDSKTECVFFPPPRFFRHEGHQALEEATFFNAINAAADDGFDPEDCLTQALDQVERTALEDAERQRYENEKARVAR